MPMKKLMAMNGAPSACGKSHRFSAEVVSGAGVITRLPEFIEKFKLEKNMTNYMKTPCNHYFHTKYGRHS